VTDPNDHLGVKIRAVMKSLSLEEKAVIELRYGLEDGVLREVEQVAENLHLPLDRVKELEAAAMQKLRERPSGL
jgi:RNA polymerase primary sigma factor